MALETKAYDIYAHLRTGYLIPFQDAFTQKIRSVYELNTKVPVGFKVNPSILGSGKWTVKD